ncbi:MAG: helix-turn-helix domain-containing protein [Candidatus Thorarchaeota archaeon]|jgi:DNA-binding CsgD family transcriptional regulator
MSELGSLFDDIEERVTPTNGSNGAVDVESIVRERTAEIMSINEDGRFNANGEKEYDMTKMRDHQQEVLRLLSTGMRPRAISDMLGVCVQTVSNIRDSKLGQAMLSMLHAERNVTIAKTAERVDAMAPKAAEIFEDIMTDPNADRSLQYRVARDTLKANGILIERRENINRDGAYLSGQEVSDLKGKFKKDFGENIEEAIVIDAKEEG